MGTEYYILCEDCKTFADLDKFYMVRRFGPETVGDLGRFPQDVLEEFCHPGPVYRMLRFLAFFNGHEGHRMRVLDCYQFEWDHETMIWHGEVWREVMKWPVSQGQRDDKVLEVEFTDPTVGRLVVKTQLGTVILDKGPNGLNVFTNDRPGGREDWLAIPDRRKKDGKDKG